MFSYDFTPSPKVCPRNIHIDLSDDGNTIEGVVFDGGCNGNTKAVSLLVEGKQVDDIVQLLSGLQCKTRGTSCADQMTIALEEARAKVQAA